MWSKRPMSSALISPGSGGISKGESELMSNEIVLGHLKQKNKELKNQIKVFKSQLASAFEVTNELPILTEKISKQEKEYRVLQGKYDEIQQRHEICIKTNEELKEKLEEEQKRNAKSIMVETETIRKQLAEERTKHHAEIANLQAQMLKAQESEEGAVLHSKKIELQLEKVFKIINDTFGTNINNSDSLISLFSSLKSETPQRIIQEKAPTAQETQIQAIIPHNNSKKIHKLEAKLQMEKQKKINLQNEHKNEMIKVEQQYQTKITQYKSKVSEIEAINQSLSSRVQDLTEEKKEMIKENAKLSAQINFLNHKNSIMPQQTPKDDDSKEKLKMCLIAKENLKQQVNSAIMKIKTLEKSKQSTKFKLQETEKKIIDLQTDIDQVIAEKNEYEAQNQNYELKIADLSQKNKMLTENVSRLEKKIDDDSKELHRTKAVHSQSLSLIETQCKEIRLLRDERVHLVELIQKQSLLTKELENTITNINFNFDILKKEQSTRIETNPEVIEEQIPSSAFSCQILPPELSDIVTQLAEKHTLRTPAKIKQILLVICQWYNEKLLQHEQEFSINKKKLEKRTNQTVDAFDFICSMYPDYDFLDSKSQTNFRLAQQKKENDFLNLQNRFENFEKENTELLLLLDASDNQSAKQKITQMNNNMIKTSVKKKEYHKKIKELSNHIAQLENELSNKENKLEEEKKLFIENQKVKTLQIENKLSEIQKENDRLKNELSSSKVQYKSFISQCESQVKQEILKQKALEEKLKARENDFNNLHQTIVTFRKQHQKKETQIEKLQKELKHTRESSDNRIQFERETMKNRYEKQIQQMNNKIDEYQNAITDLNNTISNLENENSSLITELNELSLRLEGSELKIKSKENEFTREKHLIQSQTKTHIITSEIQFKAQLEEAKTELEKTKRELMSFVVRHFCSLYDVKEQINESNFETFVINISKQFQSLLSEESKIRHLLSLAPEQPISNSISQLLLK